MMMMIIIIIIIIIIVIFSNRWQENAVPKEMRGTASNCHLSGRVYK